MQCEHFITSTWFNCRVATMNTIILNWSNNILNTITGNIIILYECKFYSIGIAKVPYKNKTQLGENRNS